jgi:hypothetical protein
MSKLLFPALLLAAFVLSCKKENSCPELEGTWQLTNYFDGRLHAIADTSEVSETLVIDNQQHFISYRTKNDEKLNEGMIYCSKVFDLTDDSFKKGSSAYYYFYERK